MRGIALVALVALVTASCGIRPRARVPNANAGTLITSEEIAETGAKSMWDALQRTVKYAHFQESGFGTPERIRRRGASTIVLHEDMMIFIDMIRVGDVQLLASMPSEDIERIQVLNGVYATTYFGTNAGDGVILIHTREAERN